MHEKPIQVDSIDSAELASAYKKALLYATKKLQRFQNTGLLSRIDALDVTNEAVTKTLSAERPWQPAKTPDLFVHLAGCINSIISNTYTSTDNQLVDRDDKSENTINLRTSDSPEANEILEFQSKVEFLFDYLTAQREDIKQVASLMLKDGITEPKEIAEELGMSVAEVNTKKLAIKRMLSRTNFLLHYVSQNRNDLIPLALAIYRDKTIDVETLSQKLNISTEDVRRKRKQLYIVIKDIYRGVI